MRSPTGEQHEIADAGYTAVVTEVGATLRVLAHDGRDVVTPFGAAEMRPIYRGALLAPWPNRVRDGSYAHGGAEHQLALSEVPRRTALHGLVSEVAWRLARRDAASVVLEHRLFPSTGYPFALDLQVTYALAGDGLTTTLRCRNVGTAPAPYGCGVHTYLVAGPGRVDAWTLELPATRRLEVDPERLLPADPQVTVPDDRWLQPAALRDVTLDDAFTGLDGDRVVARVRADDGSGVAMSWDPAVLPWVQVHTADRPEPGLNRAGLAVEPMTCPPDAFGSGVDLVVLAAGEEHHASWTVGALGPLRR